MTEQKQDQEHEGRTAKAFASLTGQQLEPDLKGEGPTASWLALAQSVFPNSRTMTRDERREFDAAFWPNFTPLDGES